MKPSAINMARIKEDKKAITHEDREMMARLEAESDRILEQLFDDPGNQELLNRLNQIDVDYVRLSGEKSMEY